MKTTRLAIIETATAQTDGPFCSDRCCHLYAPDASVNVYRCSKFGALRKSHGTAERHERCSEAEQRAKEIVL